MKIFVSTWNSKLAREEVLKYNSYLIEMCMCTFVKCISTTKLITDELIKISNDSQHSHNFIRFTSV